MRALTLKLPETLDHRLTEFARARGAGSKSEVVRLAIEAYLDEAPRAGRASAAVLARKWAGRLAGPPDLSHHPKHMADFGR